MKSKNTDATKNKLLSAIFEKGHLTKEQYRNISAEMGMEIREVYALFKDAQKLNSKREKTNSA